jgi:long-chain fatty acid transport protein
LNWSVFDAEGGSHSDNFGSYRRHIKNEFGTYGNVGYASHLANSPFTYAVGLVVQGGLGWVYKNMTTVFGTRDEATSMFSVIKLAPALSWQVNDRLSLGASLGMNYMSGSQTLFPNTSVAPSPALPTGFYGINFKDASAFGISAKMGLQYKPIDDVVVGLTYSGKTKLDMKGGTLRVNYSNLAGVGSVVRYDDAQLKGFALPQEIAIGVAYRPSEKLLISIQEKWYDWSDALSSSTLIAKNPRSNALPANLQQLTFTSQIGALDQHVYSLGAAYDWSERVTLMGGVNYGRRAIPEQNLSPTFQAIQQMHYMLGAHYRIDQEWMTDVGIERLPQQMVTYNNTATPFGPSVANHSGTVLHMTASRRW